MNNYKYEVIGAIEVISFIESQNNNLITYNQATNIAITENKQELVKYCATIPELKDYKFIFKRIIQVKQIGENSGNFRTYYKDEEDHYFCKVEFRNNIEWFTCYRNGGEPAYKIYDIHFEILP